MVKTKRKYILTSAFTSGFALILSCVSLGTSHWVVAEGEFGLASNEQLSKIRYGLFSGSYMRRLGGDFYYSIYATYWLSENVCGYLCTHTAELRKEELKKLYRNENLEFNCLSVARKNKFIDSNLGNTQRQNGNNVFINAGLHLSTLIFLSVSTAFGLIATALSVWNTAGNPISVAFSVYALYIYNLIACLSSVITLILWGTLFGWQIIRNVGIFDTIVGDMSNKGLTNLGFSYWLIIPSASLYAASIFILYLRHYFITQEPEIKIHMAADEKDAGDIMIY